MSESSKDDCVSSLSMEFDKSDVPTEKDFARYRNLILTEVGLKITSTEEYLKRLTALRKELDYIEETDWMFETADKKAQL